MRYRTLLTLLPVALFVWMGPSAAEIVETKEGKVRVETVARGLDHPWALAFLPDGRMLVTERPGRIRYVAKDGTLSEPLGGVPDVYASGQGGMLDVILDTDFEANRTIFFAYAEAGDGGAGTAVARAVLGDTGLSDVQVLWRMEPKTSGGRHFGARLVIGRDGKLYAGIGERGQDTLAQDTSVNRGQIIRINRDGTIPEDNPFIGKDGHRPEIWTYGHRNPQGMALHPETGVLWMHEHGARGGDEINIPEAGKNYGWPVIAYGRHYWGGKIGEGTHKEGMEQPIHYWDPSIAPSGMAFYTGDRFPAWKGNLFIGGLVLRLLSRLTLDGEKVVAEERLLEDMGERIRDVRNGPDGYIYLLTDSSDGRLLRLVPAED